MQSRSFLDILPGFVVHSRILRPIFSKRLLHAILHPGVSNYLVREQFLFPIRSRMLEYVVKTLMA